MIYFTIYLWTRFGHNQNVDNTAFHEIKLIEKLNQTTIFKVIFAII